MGAINIEILLKVVTVDGVTHRERENVDRKGLRTKL